MASAAVASAQPSSVTSHENANTHATKSKNSKVPAYSKKWLENVNLLKPCIMEDGSMDYSSLDEEAQKRMQNFVKDQRKCYRKRENNEATPMTDDRFRLLSEAKFDFKPSDTNKVKREKEKGEKKKKAKTEKEMAKKNVAVAGETEIPARAEAVECVEEADLSTKPTPAKSKEMAPSSDSKMPAKKSPKSASKASSPAPSSARKRSGKPTYVEMAQDAIISLKERTGSSVPAISKWILANNVHTTSVHPNTFKNRLSSSIKQGVKDGRFIKVKNSFKMNPEWTRKQKAAAKAKEAAKKES